jgi:hypothetical protein
MAHSSGNSAAPIAADDRRGSQHFAAWLTQIHASLDLERTIVTDLMAGTVLYARDRKQKSLDGFWKTITQEQRDSRLKTARAWALKEQGMLLWDYTYRRVESSFSRTCRRRTCGEQPQERG